MKWERPGVGSDGRDAPGRRSARAGDQHSSAHLRVPTLFPTPLRPPTLSEDTVGRSISGELAMIL